MRLAWVLVLVLAVAGCSPPQGRLVEPVYNGYDGGLAEPVMEAAVVTAAPARVAAPLPRPGARPAWIEACRPGDDGIGGTGCKID